MAEDADLMLRAVVARALRRLHSVGGDAPLA